VIPIRDDVPASRTPIVNYGIIAVCAVVFLVQLSDPEGQLVERFGMIPARVTDPELSVRIVDAVTPFGEPLHWHEAESAGVPDLLTLLTCTFLHGGWLHFLGNMWFLWIFGDNVEDRLGRVRYLLFYLAGGILASLTHFLLHRDSQVPVIGASGAIAGVMGAYMLLYPKARVLTAVPIFYFIEFLVLPAPFFLGIWFLLQLVPGIGELSGAHSEGVAVWAHIGGFAYGALVVWFMRVQEWLRPPPPTYILQRRRMSLGGFNRTRY
jgi:rhomboid family protein